MITIGEELINEFERQEELIFGQHGLQQLIRDDDPNKALESTNFHGLTWFITYDSDTKEFILGANYYDGNDEYLDYIQEDIIACTASREEIKSCIFKSIRRLAEDLHERTSKADEIKDGFDCCDVDFND